MNGYTGVTLLVMISSNHLSHETLPPEKRTPIHMLDVLNAYFAMLKSSSFIVPLIPVMLCFAVQGTYLVASPFIFIRVLHMLPAMFGLTCILLVGGLMTGRFICLYMVEKRGDYVTFLTGCMIAFSGGLLSLAIIGLNWTGATPLLTAATLFCIGFGTLLPIGMKTGLSAFRKRVGASSALYGCLTLGATAAGSAIAGSLLNQSERDIRTLCIVTAAAGSLILLSGLMSRHKVG